MPMTRRFVLALAALSMVSAPACTRVISRTPLAGAALVPSARAATPVSYDHRFSFTAGGSVSSVLQRDEADTAVETELTGGDADLAFGIQLAQRMGLDIGFLIAPTAEPLATDDGAGITATDGWPAGARIRYYGRPLETEVVSLDLGVELGAVIVPSRTVADVTRQTCAFGCTTTTVREDSNGTALMPMTALFAILDLRAAEWARFHASATLRNQIASTIDGVQFGEIAVVVAGGVIFDADPIEIVLQLEWPFGTFDWLYGPTGSLALRFEWGDPPGLPGEREPEPYVPQSVPGYYIYQP